MSLKKVKKVKILFIIICSIQLFYLFHSRSVFNYEIFKDPFSERSGVIYALSSEVIESNNILTKHKVSDFNISKEIKNDNYLYQRFTEFNYPIRIKKSSKFIFYLAEEDVPNECTIIEKGKYLQLVEC